jgi:hypothetical protein
MYMSVPVAQTTNWPWVENTRSKVAAYTSGVVFPDLADKQQYTNFYKHVETW